MYKIYYHLFVGDQGCKMSIWLCSYILWELKVWDRAIDCSLISYSSICVLVGGYYLSWTELKQLQLTSNCRPPMLFVLYKCNCQTYDVYLLCTYPSHCSNFILFLQLSSVFKIAHFGTFYLQECICRRNTSIWRLHAMAKRIASYMAYYVIRFATLSSSPKLQKVKSCTIFYKLNLKTKECRI